MAKPAIGLFIACILITVLGCTRGIYPSTIERDTELIKFANRLTGEFSSKRQAAADSTYLAISLSMTPIWINRTDGIWLYVEQALADKKEKPYRQRVYKLNHPQATTFTSEIYTIRNASDVVGLQKDPSKAAALTYDQLDKKEGCTVFLKKVNQGYEGGTEGKACLSELRGARYATSIIRLGIDYLESWDQGFDASDKQVWGATKGGYLFIRE